MCLKMCRNCKWIVFVRLFVRKKSSRFNLKINILIENKVKWYNNNNTMFMQRAFHALSFKARKTIEYYYWFNEYFLWYFENVSLDMKSFFFINKRTKKLRNGIFSFFSFSLKLYKQKNQVLIIYFVVPILRLWLYLIQLETFIN